MAPDELVFAGIGITATFKSRIGGERVGILNVDSGHFIGGKWSHLRYLNGDETGQGKHVRIPPSAFGIQRVKLYRYH